MENQYHLPKEIIGLVLYTQKVSQRKQIKSNFPFQVKRIRKVQISCLQSQEFLEEQLFSTIKWMLTSFIGTVC